MAAQALTVFLRENWQNTNYETVEVTLVRDPALGLGITVAGYVHRKEEIGGVFVKSLVPRSAATQSGRIWVHDLILEVNGTSLEHLSHADSVRTLVKSGDRVTLKLIRFPPNSLQAQCLKMLQEQETDTQVIDVQSSNPDLVTEWKRRLSNDIDIISAIVKPDRKEAGDGGLGISLEGNCDLVNHSPLYGESHVTVRQALTRAVHSGAPVTLIVARKTQHVNLFQPKTERSLPLAYPLLAAGQDRMVKAKSEVNISFPSSDTSMLLRQVSRRLRSRSLEPFTGLAIWNCVPLVFFLEKDSRGLGFSIVDYQDPLHPGESVIVIQSLVPGGLAQADGRIVPDMALKVFEKLGEKCLYLLIVIEARARSNTRDGRNGLAVLKYASNLINNSIAASSELLLFSKPLPWEDVVAPHILRSSPGASDYLPEAVVREGKGDSPSQWANIDTALLIPAPASLATSVITSSQETVWIGAEQYRKLHPQVHFAYL
uniref:PDZ domain-containing protein n=1 Tax=Heterorhabditis bacteriophora TaxID=37862 RepID=A0A1I7WXJ6_HETBA